MTTKLAKAYEQRVRVKAEPKDCLTKTTIKNGGAIKKKAAMIRNTSGATVPRIVGTMGSVNKYAGFDTRLAIDELPSYHSFEPQIDVE